MHFIRNHIHHPENQYMKSNMYDMNDLELSIAQMIKIIKNYSNKTELDRAS